MPCRLESAACMPVADNGDRRGPTEPPRKNRSRDPDRSARTARLDILFQGAPPAACDPVQTGARPPFDARQSAGGLIRPVKARIFRMMFASGGSCLERVKGIEPSS